MVTIQKGSNKFIVSDLTYKTVFQKLGYNIVEETKKAEVRVENPTLTLENQIQLKEEVNEEVINSKTLKEEVGEKIENDFGFERKSRTKRK